MRDAQRRTTKDLIAEMDDEAKKFSEVLLAVGFEKRSMFIRSSDENRLQALNDAIREGGEPVGLIGLVTDSNKDGFVSQVNLYSRLLKEFAEEVWARDYLHAIVTTQGRILAQLQGATNFASNPGWTH